MVKLLLLSIYNVKLCHDMDTDIDMKEMVSNVRYIESRPNVNTIDFIGYYIIGLAVIWIYFILYICRAKRMN